MKYFTPELFVRVQNIRDEAALQSWEQAVEAYTTFVKEVSGRLPKPLRRIVEEFRLHDADVLSVSRAGESLAITLQQEPPDGSLLVLTYSLVDPPFIDRFALPGEFCTEDVSWLYDEIGIGESSADPVYTHDILFSNGWEICLRFHKLKLSRPEALIPPPHAGMEREPIVPQSA